MYRPVSIVIPYIRPELIENVWEQAKKHSDGIPIEIVSEYDEKRIGFPKMFNYLVSKTKYDLICYLSDDTIPLAGFLKTAQEAMKEFPDGWGMVVFNDGVYSDGRTAYHWLADKRLLPILGGKFVHEGYWHSRADREWTDRVKEADRHIFCREAKIKQNRPENDQNYKKYYSPEWVKHDNDLYLKRKAESWP